MRSVGDLHDYIVTHNPRSGEAQLIAKDAEYANAVVGECARLF